MSGIVLKIMVVNEHADRAALLETALREAGYEVVGGAHTSDYLPQCIERSGADVVLIDIDAPSRDTLEQIGAVNARQPRPIVMFTRQQDQQIIEQAVRAGVTAYVIDGLSSASVRSVIDVAMATFERFQSLRKELDEAKTSLAERKIIDRAKGILMTQRNLSEPDAYRMLQKLAMDRKRRLADIARDVVDMAEVFTPHSSK